MRVVYILIKEKEKQLSPNYIEGSYLIEDLELCKKVTDNFPYFDLVIDEEMIVDVILTVPPEKISTKEEINQQVVAKIREVYSVDDEFQMQRLGLQDSNNAEYQGYLQYVNDCIIWGVQEKVNYGYV